MATALLYPIFTSSSLVSPELYHLIASIHNYLKFPESYLTKPFHIFPTSASNNNNNGHRLRYLQLYLLMACLSVAFVHQVLIASNSDPLLKGRTPVHRFTSLQSAVVLFLYLVLSVSLFLSDCFPSLLPIPHDLFFSLASALFYLQSSVSFATASFQTSDLQAKCDYLSSGISALSSLLCLLLACLPRLFVADVGLAASIFLQGLWTLQTGLSLYVDAFIPEGCHRLLDVIKGVEGSTKCDLEESSLRAVAILDLAFLVHVMFDLFIVMVIYAILSRIISARRLGSYEALPTAAHDQEHIQIKSPTGTQA